MARCYPEFAISQQQPRMHQLVQSYNPQVNDVPRPRKQNENPKDYMLSSYTKLEHVYDINSSTSIYRLDPFVKYLCAWTTDVCTEEINAIKERTTWKQPNLISFLFFEEIPDRFQVIRIFYEYLPLDVKQLIEKRAPIKAYVPEDEILKMIQGLTSAFYFLQKRGINHQALQLQSVFFDEEYLLYRIHDISPFKAKAGHLFQCQFPAPETLPPINKFKADVFSLGVIVLSLMLLKDLSFIYINKNILDINQLQQQIDEMEKIYQGSVKEIVKSMLQVNPAQRSDWIELQQQANVDCDNQKPTRSQSSVKGNIGIFSKNNIFQEQKSSIANIENKTVESRRITLTDSKSKKGEQVNNRLQSLNKKIQETLTKSQQQGQLR